MEAILIILALSCLFGRNNGLRSLAVILILIWLFS